MTFISKVGTVSAAGLALVLLAGAPASLADSMYKGKTVTLIVPNSPAGQMTEYAQTIAPYIAKHLGARTVRVDNQPGGGGLKGTNTLAASDPDGLTIGFTNIPSLVMAQLAGSPGVRFDATKLTYLGRAAAEPRVVAVGGKSPIKTVDDIKKLGRPFVYASQGTDEDFYSMVILANALGYPMKIVTGYEGNADTSLAVIKGEADGHMTSWTASKPAVEAGEKRIVLVIAPERVPDLPDVPNAAELVQDPKQKAALAAVTDIIGMSRGFFGPANMDPAATKEMRAAIEAALKDPELLAEATKKRLPIVFASGEDLQKKVQSVVTSGAELKAPLAAALQSIK
jgi:tripartite-type tricarboxylate transporter receptor subunit TctC